MIVVYILRLKAPVDTVVVALLLKYTNSTYIEQTRQMLVDSHFYIFNNSRSSQLWPAYKKIGV